MRIFSRLGTLLILVIALAACGGGGDGGNDTPVTPPVSSTPPPADPPPNDPPPDDPPPEDPPPVAAYKNLFTPVDDVTWDETAVRKVLHTFAYGGQTTDAQISAWAAMAPEDAIAQMLTFEKHNLLLSTPSPDDIDGLASRDGSLRGLAEFWASADPANPTPLERRELFAIDNFNGSLSMVWERAATSRGLNPFRAKIGFWETNYHMAVNLMTSVPRLPLLRYYEDIMAAHEQGLPYHEVMAIAASSAAIALQYGHRSNRYRSGVCDCNEDFAREYHQLFFGVLGDADPDYHETVTIKNTAKAFTDMSVYADDRGPADVIDFGTFFHPDEPLEILGTMIGGTNARERIDEMVRVSIEHPESLANLPVRIVSELADDNLDTRKISAIRSAWARMDEKNLLSFLRGYAISTIFHDPSRVKYLTSVDRHLLFANLTGTSNRDNYIELYRARYTDEDMFVFVPTHNVFGSQKGTEAASSDLVFRKAVNLSTEGVWRLRNPSGERLGESWTRDWGTVIPKAGTNRYRVADVAEWLWRRYTADGLKNYGPLEQAHLHALLGGDRDIGYLVDPIDPDRVITTDDVLLDPGVVTLLRELGDIRLDLDSATADLRDDANRRLGMAINFITATPFIFAQEGR